MADYTAHIVIRDYDNVSKETLYSAGSIISIHPLISEQHSKSKMLGFVHVINTPDDLTLDGLSAELSRTEINSNSPEIGESVWYVDLDKINTRNLLENNTVTIDWLDARGCFIRNSDGLTGGEFYDGFNK